ncbi:hypothetical protein BCR33DRAFT_723876 [Rhizoclosmatium globosum]|uniref:Prolyl endopeptidase n=1 Tax=Rhizoclosmatium globosum TaxID=329046 RepID=A0A1Y2BAM2_9FUNG|nr:hypothetical protein BCR33DRAFT_723876 [Rhizoclosmatium globosum]|eukprot:ORY31527.1 hypothetical protein BCR33DRAFT_723876 [Rhizoclosmatium globosum]
MLRKVETTTTKTTIKKADGTSNTKEVKTITTQYEAIAKALFTYPTVRRDDQVDILHGVEIKHPYRHLEDPDAPETKQFVEDQGKLFQDFIKSKGGDVRTKLEARFTEMFNYERYGLPFKKGDNYYYFHNSGLQPQSVLYTQKTVDGEASVFFDPNTLSQDGTVSLSTYSFSESGKLFAYAVSDSGSDWVKIHVREVGADKDLEVKPLEWAKFTGIEWTHDEKGFFYNRYPAPSVSLDKAGTETDVSKNQAVYYHRIGTDQSEDIVIYKDPEHPDWGFGSTVSDCGRYIIIGAWKGTHPESQIYYADLEKQFGGKSVLGVPEFTTIVGEWKGTYDWIANEGTVFYFVTSDGAPNKSVVKYDVAQPELGFSVVIPEVETAIDYYKVVANNKLVLVYLQDVKHVIKVHDLTTGEYLHNIDLPTGSVIKGISGSKSKTEVFYNFGSFISPGITRRFDFANGQDTLFKETIVPGFDSSIFEVKQVFYPSADGTKIPMYIFHKKGLELNGENPAFQYAYGGFNISILPSFSVAWLTFAEKFNGVVAIANIRGGGEYGQAWHDAGRLFNKQNCSTDFQYASRYLISEKYTKPAKLAINGGSNGGLLIGTVLNQAPELYGLGIADVGVHDLLRFHKFTIGHAWTSDFGSPDVKEDFENILKISPLHNVDSKKAYPAVLIVTGDHDDRVVPLHSLKLGATMQYELKNNAKPIMMRINSKAGHGAGKSIQQTIEELSDKYTYLSITLDAPYFD